jgi:hypothetical protein
LFFLFKKKDKRTKNTITKRKRTKG